MNEKACTLRIAHSADARQIALMSRDLIETGLGWKYHPARVLKALRTRDNLTVAACERDRVLGFAIMEFGDERAHLVLLAVRPAHRRLGIGRRMLDWLVESALVAGIASIHLELRAGNEAARGFYRAMGFTETLLVPGYYQGRESALRMLRLLRAAAEPAYTWRPPRTGERT